MIKIKSYKMTQVFLFIIFLLHQILRGGGGGGGGGELLLLLLLLLLFPLSGLNIPNNNPFSFLKLQRKNIVTVELLN